MKKIFNWLIDKWLAGFITGCILLAAKIYIDLPAKEKAFFFDFSWLSAILNYQIPFWQVGIICGFFIIVIVFKKKKKISEKNETSRAPANDRDPIMDYNLDVFGANNRLWAWDLEYNSYKDTHFIKNVTPCCPVCDNKLSPSYQHRIGLCRICRLENKEKFEHEVTEISEDINAAIMSRSNDGSWVYADERIKTYKKRK